MPDAVAVITTISEPLLSLRHCGQCPGGRSSFSPYNGLGSSAVIMSSGHLGSGTFARLIASL